MSKVRYRLTLLGPAREELRQRRPALAQPFHAPATHSLRFYREYFKPAREIWSRRIAGAGECCSRHRVLHQPGSGEEPDLGYFIEVKSRTWSRRDAEHKAELARDLIACLGAARADAVAEDYVEIAANT